MDEKLNQLIVSVNEPVLPQPIPTDAHFYRQVFLRMIDGKKHIPSPKCFAYIPQSLDDGLSVDWAALTTPELSLAILGSTFKHGSEELKDPKEYAIFRIDGTFLAGLKDGPTNRHDPIFRTNPPRHGEPNNPSHSVLRYSDPDDLEIRVKLQNHAERIVSDQDLVTAVFERLQGMEQ